MSLEDVALRLAIAALAGMAIGLEREWREKSAGFRTLTLVSTASAVFVLAALAYLPVEGVRMMAGVATGIGFIGAGAILRSRGEILGLTTAASIWMAAGLGVSAALAQFSVTLVGTILTVIVLFVLSRIPFKRIHRDVRIYRISFVSAVPMDDALSADRLEAHGLTATLQSVSIAGDAVTVSWVAEGRRGQHQETLVSLKEDEKIATLEFGE